MPNQQVDLSVVITAHNEGLTAHKSILSIERAIKLLEDISFEIVVSVDNGDTETRQYFDRYNNKTPYRILSVNYKGLSESRNNALKEARGNIVTFLDADDLISENWLKEGYGLAISNDVIVHPEFSITFEGDNLVWQKKSSGRTDYERICFIDNNLWDSPSMAKRKLYLDHPYVPNGDGYGFEDKHFNCSTLADGIQHLVAPKTILFVRRKAFGSMLKQSNTDLVTIAPTPLLSFRSMRSIELEAMPSYTPTASRSKVIANQVTTLATGIHKKLKGNRIYSKVTKKLRTRLLHLKNIRENNRFPSWLIQEWRAIHKIENRIFPSKELLSNIPNYNAEDLEPGIAYVKLMKELSDSPDTLVFVPWLIKGGADMLFINYSNELKRTHPEWKVAVLQTENKNSIWGEKLASNIDYVNLFSLFKELDQDTQYRLIATLLTQCNVRRIVVGNSQLAYDFINSYKSLIKRLNIAIYCFAFGEEFDEEGRLWGHIHTGIPKIYDVTHRIITDNQTTINKLVDEYAFDENLFRVHYQPTKTTLRKPQQSNNRPIRILWASRVCKQKRPDILKSISNRLDGSRFAIDAYGQLEESFTKEYFNDSKVNYKGAFNGICTIPTDQYDIYLYTSEGDGIPNVLQEITACGLPIVASGVGGIGEFIQTGRTGFLIKDHNNIEKYVDSLEKLLDSNLRASLAEDAQLMLKDMFSSESWRNSVKNDFDK